MKKTFLMALAALMLSPLASSATSVWDGTTDTSWERDADGNYLITSAAELAGLAKVVNENELVYQGNTELHAFYGSGMTFILTTDIDLGNRDWNPIGYLAKDNVTNTNRVKRFFCGDFDGRGHIITNCNASLDGVGGGSGNSRIVTVGLFGAISGSTIKNLGITNSTFYVKSNAHENYGGALVGWMENGSTILNCSSVNNSVTVNSPWTALIKYGTARAGGIAGSAQGSTITDCAAAGNSVKADGSKNESSAGIANNYSGSDVATGNNTYATQEEMKADTETIARKNEKAVRENVVNNANPPYYLWSEETGMISNVAVFSLNTTPVIIGGGALNVYAPNAVEYTFDGVTYTTVTNLDEIHVAGLEYVAPTMESNGYRMHYYKCFCNGIELAHRDANGTIDFDDVYVGANGNVTIQGVFTPYYLVNVETNGVSDAFVYGESTYAARENEFVAITLFTDTIFESGDSYRYYTIKSLTLNGSEVKDLVVPGNISTFEFAMPAMTANIYVEFEENVYTSVGKVEEQTTRIYGVDDALIAVSAEPTRLVVVSIDGRVVYDAIVSNCTRVELPAGIYVANNQKVVVR